MIGCFASSVTSTVTSTVTNAVASIATHSISIRRQITVNSSVLRCQLVLWLVLWRLVLKEQAPTRFIAFRGFRIEMLLSGTDDAIFYAAKSIAPHNFKRNSACVL